MPKKDNFLSGHLNASIIWGKIKISWRSFILMPLLSNNNSGYWVQRGRLLCITHSEPLQTSLVGCCERLAQVLEIKVAIVHRYIPRNVCLITAGRFARSQHNKMNSFLPVWTVGECERSYQAMKRTKVIRAEVIWLWFPWGLASDNPLSLTMREMWSV